MMVSFMLGASRRSTGHQFQGARLRNMPRKHSCISACVLAACLLSPHALAQGDTTGAATAQSPAPDRGSTSVIPPAVPLTFLVGASLTNDSNVFRLSDAAADPVSASGEAGKSDRYAIASVGLRFDKEYSLQRLRLEIVDRVYRYDKFDILDRDELNYLGTWNWRVGPRFDGTLLAERTENLVGIEETQARLNNVRVTTRRAASAGAMIDSNWRVLAGVLGLETKNSIPSLVQPDNRQTGGEVGVSYLTASQNSFAVVRRTLRGKNTNQPVDFVNFIDSGFKVDESELTATWIMTANHSFSGRVTRIERRHDNIPQRDFAGNAGNATYQWTPTDRLTMAFAATRSVQPWTEDLSASFRVEEGFSFAPTWRITEKTSLSMLVYRAEGEYLGAILPGAAGREDVVRATQVVATWAPRTSLVLSARVRREQRTSTDVLFDYDATIASVDASMAF